MMVHAILCWRTVVEVMFRAKSLVRREVEVKVCARRDVVTI